MYGRHTATGHPRPTVANCPSPGARCTAGAPPPPADRPPAPSPAARPTVGAPLPPANRPTAANCPFPGARCTAGAAPLARRPVLRGRRPGGRWRRGWTGDVCYVIAVFPEA